ncbi:hypothetical protein ACFY0A_44930 [Streptomyces sp. NPDC001698]|uniref:hypothetical protein n=1 Tax=unclassified Streptomyces TaxID=2593676 RepID=UPI003692A1DB
MAEEKEAAEWAERLFKKTCVPGPVVPEPTTPEAVRAAIERFAELPTETGVMQDLAIGARRAAKGVSTDRLQELSEVVQNAEDLGATEVRIPVREATVVGGDRPVMWAEAARVAAGCVVVLVITRPLWSCPTSGSSRSPHHR